MQWALESPARTVDVTVESRFRLNSPGMIRRLAVLDQGIVLMPEEIVADEAGRWPPCPHPAGMARAPDPGLCADRNPPAARQDPAFHRLSARPPAEWLTASIAPPVEQCFPNTRIYPDAGGCHMAVAGATAPHVLNRRHRSD